MNILIVEDDSDMQKILKLYLQREGYQVNSVSNGWDAVDFLIVNAVDIVLLDWMMPIKNGMETLKEIRQLNIPVKILMLTAKGENADEAAGLTFGADDYLRKPFDIQILLLRIKKLCNSENLLRCNDIVLNPVTMEVMKGQDNVKLTKNEFELLKYFLANQNMILTREQLLNHIWGMDFEGDIRTVDTNIRRLRQKIGEEYIQTIIEEASRLTALASNILNLSKIEQQSILTERTRLNVSEQIRQVIALLDKRWSAKDITVAFDCGEHFVVGNKELLKQVWINLADNAIKFSPEHETVEISIRETPAALVISFANKGDEIPAAAQSHIFDKFYQADTSHATQGNGLGLAIVHKIIGLHGGTVKVRRSDLTGTIMDVTLPQK